MVPLRRPRQQVLLLSKSRWSRAPTSTTPGPASCRTTSTGVNLDFNGDGTKKFAEISRAAVRHPGSSSRSSSTAASSPRPRWTASSSTGRPRSAAISTRSPPEPGHQPALRLAAVSRSRRTPRSRPSALARRRLAQRVCWRACIGLGPVMIYCLLYYRGLGIVSSLADRGRRHHLRRGAAARQDRRLHADPARHRGTDHRRSVSPPTRSSSTSNASGTRCATASPCASPSRPAGSAPGTPAWRPTWSPCWPPSSSTSSRPASEGLRVRAGHLHGHRPRDPLLVHLPDGLVARAVPVLQPGSQVVQLDAGRSASTGSTSAPSPAGQTAGGKA